MPHDDLKSVMASVIPIFLHILLLMMIRILCHYDIIWISFSCGLPVWGNRGMKSIDNSVQILEWNVKFWAQSVKGFCAWLFILYQSVHIAAKSQNDDKRFLWMTGLQLTVLFTWKEEGLWVSCFGHILRKRYSENPLPFKHQLGF